MKIEFEHESDQVTFRLTNVDSWIEKALRMCFYEQEGDAFVKRFPADTPDLDRIMAHYEAHAEEMFLQLVYQRPVPWEDGLRRFLGRARDTGIRWWLTGSCATCLRGVDLDPHDVDIMVDSQDVARIREVFRDVVIEPIIDTNGWLTKDFGVLFDACRIDIASDPQACLDDPEPVDCGPYAQVNLETIEWEGFRVPVPPVELQLNANRRRERHDRVQRIEAHMARNAA